MTVSCYAEAVSKFERFSTANGREDTRMGKTYPDLGQGPGNGDETRMYPFAVHSRLLASIGGWIGAGASCIALLNVRLRRGVVSLGGRNHPTSNSRSRVTVSCYAEAVSGYNLLNHAIVSPNRDFYKLFGHFRSFFGRFITCFQCFVACFDDFIARSGDF